MHEEERIYGNIVKSLIHSNVFYYNSYTKRTARGQFFVCGGGRRNNLNKNFYPQRTTLLKQLQINNYTVKEGW